METAKEEPPPVFLERVSRASRGKRMTRLLDEELEEDELFWNQDALKEEDNDDNYEEEAEVADVFDSDFDDDEPEPDEEVENVAEERTQRKKRLIFPGKLLDKKKKKKESLLKSDRPSKNEKLPQESAASKHDDGPDDVEGERMVRKSTRTAVIVKQAERDAIRAALQATTRPIKRKKEGEEKKITQEEMLLEAAQTEIMNMRNLERVLAREEEVKKRAIVHKAVYSGPQIRYSSKNGYSCLEFTGLSFQSQISTTSEAYPEKPICAITGLPAKNHGSNWPCLLELVVLCYAFTCQISSSYAYSIVDKYRDPKTGLPYATKEAFKAIRERFADENKNTQKKMDMGSLVDSLNGEGFSKRRERGPISKRRKYPCIPYLFRRSPTIEIDSSE